MTRQIICSPLGEQKNQYTGKNHKKPDLAVQSQLTSMVMRARVVQVHACTRLR